MSEVQAHGNIFEDQVIRQVTGISKNDYQKLLSGGYTHPMDIVQGVLSDFNASVKTTENNSVDCADFMTFMKACKNNSFKLIIGQWRQENDCNKKFHSVYEFDWTPEFYSKLFGNLNEEIMNPFIDYVKSIPSGKHAQQENKTLWKEKRDKIYESVNSRLVTINAKIDSRTQRRTQAGIKIDSLINIGVPHTVYQTNYREIELPYEIKSAPRSFKNKAT
jgi:hypothetical protein